MCVCVLTFNYSLNMQDKIFWRSFILRNSMKLNLYIFIVPGPYLNYLSLFSAQQSQAIPESTSPLPAIGRGFGRCVVSLSQSLTRISGILNRTFKLLAPELFF